MPNDCFNHITITCDNEDELHALVKNELQNKEGNKYIYNEKINMIKKGKKGIIFELVNNLYPDFNWFNILLDTYPHCWIKNEWCEEGGTAGVWIGSVKNNRNFIQSM